MTYRIEPHRVRTKTPAQMEAPHGITNIPNCHLPKIEVFDNVINEKLHQKIWEYLNGIEWYQYWHDLPGELQIHRPRDGDSWINAASIHRTLAMPRSPLASDESSLKSVHPLIHLLWLEINKFLGNQYEITGPTEGMIWDLPCPPTADPELKQGWRVYANATVHDNIALGGHVHRDNPDLLDETSFTIIWIANTEWYPTWGGHLLFYPEDHGGTTGDHQQFETSWIAQNRSFNIGWPDDGRMVTLRPNRLLVYDSRALHSANPTTRRWNCDVIRRVVFRARLRPDFKV